MAKPPDEKYSEGEIQKRFEDALRSALKTPPKPLKEKPKVGKQIRKKSAATQSRK